MKSAPGVIVVLLLAVASSACGRLQARTEPVRPPLDTPPPPAHLIEPMIVEVVEPAEPVEPVEPSEPEPAGEPPKPPRRAVARPALSGAEERTPPSSPPPADSPQYSLQTTTKVTEAERKIRGQLAQAVQNLNRTDYGALSVEAQAQYDIAKRFAQQAEDALRSRNLVFAAQLADKAAELAGILAKR